MSPQTIEQRANNYITEFGTPPPDEEEEPNEETNNLTVAIRLAYVKHATIISAIMHAEDMEFEGHEEDMELITEILRLERHAKSHHQMLCQLYLEQVREARDDALCRECHAFHLANEAEEAELAAQYENYEYDGEAEEDDEDDGGEYEAPEEGETYEDEDDEDEPPRPPREAEGNYTFSDGCEAPPPTYAFAHARAIQEFDEVINSNLEESNELSADNIAELEELRAGRSRHMRALHGVDSDSDAEDDMHTQDT